MYFLREVMRFLKIVQCLFYGNYMVNYHKITIKLPYFEHCTIFTFLAFHFLKNIPLGNPRFYILPK